MAECGYACDQLPACSGFVWMRKPFWSKYSECYLKPECLGGKLRAAPTSGGVYAFDRVRDGRCTKRHLARAWLSAYGEGVSAVMEDS